MHSQPIQIVLRPESAAPHRASHRYARRVSSARPSLAVALARSLALALFMALAVLTQVAKAQTAARPTTSSTVSAEPPRSPAEKSADKTAARTASDDQSVGAALRRSADRHGLWGSIGVGRGSAGLSCETCASETTRAYALHGTLGMRLSPRFLVGAETFAWLDVIGGGVDRIARGTYLIARTYPFTGSTLFLHGGLGLASFQVNDGEVAFTTRSPSLSLAAGYDWHLGGLTVTPSIAAITSTGGRLNSDRTGNAITDNARLGLLRSSVALSWFR